MLTLEGSQFDLVTLATGLMMSGGNIHRFAERAAQDRTYARLLPHITKAAASTDSVTELGVAFGQTEGFLRALSNSALDVMRGRFALANVPILSAATAVTGVIAERQRFPILTSLEQFALTLVKTGGISLATKDQLENGIYGEAILGAAMRNGVASCSNRALAETLEADAGTTTVTASGTTGAHILADIASASDGFELDGESVLYLLASPQDIKNLALKNGSGILSFPNCGPRGGELLPAVQAIACVGFPEGDSNGAYALLVDAGGLLMNTGELYISTTHDSVLQMIDPDGGAETKGVSLFQEDLLGLRYVRTFAVKPMRACVCKISAINW